MGGEVPFTRCVAVHQVAPSGLGASWRHASWRQFLKKKLFKCSTSWSRFLRSKRCHFPTHFHLATSLPEAAPCHSALVKQSSRRSTKRTTTLKSKQLRKQSTLKPPRGPRGA